MTPAPHPWNTAFAWAATGLEQFDEWHQDNGYVYVEPQAYLTVWLALTDATVDNGCPWIAPGRHRLGTLARTYVDPLGWEVPVRRPRRHRRAGARQPCTDPKRQYEVRRGAHQIPGTRRDVRRR